MVSIVVKKFPEETAPYLIKIFESIPGHKTGVFLKVVKIVPESQIRWFANLCQKYPKFLDIVGSTNMLKFLVKHPQYAEHLYQVAKKFPGEITLDIFKKVNKLPSGAGPKIIKELSILAKDPNSVFNANHMIALHRILHGKTYSPKHIDEFFQILRKGLDQNSIGHLAEEMVFTAINSKRLKNKHLLNLKPNSKVIKGQHNSIHGIDLIGVGPNGKPVIIEVTTGKNFKPNSESMTQMSPEWVADRWALFVKDPQNVAKLKEMGITKQYLPPNKLTKEMVEKGVDRKVIAPASASFTNFKQTGMNGLDDIIPL